MAVRRGEAVNLDGVERQITQTVGAGYRVVRTEDEQFPFLVTISLEKVVSRK